eukprot:GEMP01088474.1.p1 GENE.GEMP01088474.1~~GEMP01088474.1.p1  ORF type:complete len:189 (+),score=23.81 GEMP01088474.1:63-569(+)
MGTTYETTTAFRSIRRVQSCKPFAHFANTSLMSFHPDPERTVPAGLSKVLKNESTRALASTWESGSLIGMPLDAARTTANWRTFKSISRSNSLPHCDPLSAGVCPLMAKHGKMIPRDNRNHISTAPMTIYGKQPEWKPPGQKPGFRSAGLPLCADYAPPWGFTAPEVS